MTRLDDRLRTAQMRLLDLKDDDLSDAVGEARARLAGFTDALHLLVRNLLRYKHAAERQR